MRNKRLLWGLVLLIGLTFIFHPAILNWAGSRLIVQDPLEKADVILVLAGDDNGERVDEAVKLYKQGYAKKLLMSGGRLAWRLTYAQWMRKQAVAEGVPQSAIILQDKSRSTVDDANFSLPIVKQHNFKSVLLVTSPSHSRRAKRVFHKVFKPEGIKIIIYPVQVSEFNPDRWWTRHEDTAFVVWEYVSSVLYFFKGY